MAASIEDIFNDNNVNLNSIKDQTSALKQLSNFMNDLMKTYATEGKGSISSEDSKAIQAKLNTLMDKTNRATI